MGIAYLAAMLEKNNIEVKVLDALAEGWENEYTKDGWNFVGLSNDDICGRIKDYSPDVVGITIPFTTQSENAYNVAKIAKLAVPNATVVAGGPHPTIQTENTLKCLDIDYVIKGEGELSFVDFIQKFSKKEDFLSVKGLAYRSGEGIVENEKEAIKDLDSLPYPAWHLLPMEAYFKAANKVKASRSISTFRRKWATIITSRGCPYRCTFCSIQPTMGYKWRWRSPENVVNEMEYLKEHFGIQHFDIEDDNFALTKARTDAILDLMIERKLNVEWSTPNGIMAQQLDEGLVKKMKKSGCKRMIVAPESGDQNVVKNIINKNIDLDRVENTVRWAKKYGIIVESFFIIGFPDETIEDIKTTISFAKKLRKLGVDDCAFYIATPFYGTELYYEAKDKGYLRDLYGNETLNTMSGEPLIETPNFSADDLKALWLEAQKVNPPISIGRMKLALSILISDPLRFMRYGRERIVERIKFLAPILGKVERAIQ